VYSKIFMGVNICSEKLFENINSICTNLCYTRYNECHYATVCNKQKFNEPYRSSTFNTPKNNWVGHVQILCLIIALPYKLMSYEQV